jgi:hypothetical protein
VVLKEGVKRLVKRASTEETISTYDADDEIPRLHALVRVILSPCPSTVADYRHRYLELLCRCLIFPSSFLDWPSLGSFTKWAMQLLPLCAYSSLRLSLKTNLVSI